MRQIGIRSGTATAEAEVTDGADAHLRDGALPAEPATPRALWPTFMRRTLPEEELRRVPQPAAAE